MDIEHELDLAYKASLMVFQDEIKSKTNKKLELDDIQLVAQMAAMLNCLREKYNIGKVRDRYDDFIPANDLVLDLLFKADYYQDYDATKWHNLTHSDKQKTTKSKSKTKKTKRNGDKQSN